MNVCAGSPSWGAVQGGVLYSEWLTIFLTILLTYFSNKLLQCGAFLHLGSLLATITVAKWIVFVTAWQDTRGASSSKDNDRCRLFSDLIS